MDKRKIKNALMKPSIKIEELISENFINNAAPCQTFSFVSVLNISISNKSIHRSSIRGSIFKEINFENIDFTRSDIDTSRFENGIFKNCDFTYFDLIACYFMKISFINCKFNTSAIRNCTFNETHFLDCDFSSASFSDCLVQKGSFEHSILSKGGITLNYYTNTNFKNMILADCTFEKNIFTNCKFDHCKIEVSYLGTLFGIKISDLEKMELIYLGKDSSIDFPIKDVLTLIDNEYKKRGLFIPREIFRLNYGLSSAFSALLNIRDIILSIISSELILSKDEAIFLERILEYLFQNSKLPYLIVIEYKKAVDYYLKKESAKKDSITRSSINSLQVKLHSLFHEMSQTLCQIEDEDMQNDVNRIITVSIAFFKKPSVDVVPFLNSLTKSAGIDLYIKAKKTNEMAGSYIEFIECAFATIITLRIFIYLINGVLIQVEKSIDSVSSITSKLKHFKKNVRSKAYDLRYSDKVLEPTQNLVTYLHKLPALGDLLENGINAGNIKKVLVNYNPEFPNMKKQNKSKCKS